MLRPGGRAVILDSDHATRITSDLEHSVEQRMNAAFQARTANPYAARNVPRQAIAAGLIVEPDVGSAALVMPREASLDQSLIAIVAAQAVADGTVTPAEAEAALASFRAATEAGWGFSAVTVFGFVLRKPA